MWYLKGKYKDGEVYLYVYREYQDYKNTLIKLSRVVSHGKVPDELCKDGATIDEVFKQLAKEIL